MMIGLAGSLHSSKLDSFVKSRTFYGVSDLPIRSRKSEVWPLLNEPSGSFSSRREIAMWTSVGWTRAEEAMVK